MDLSRQAAALLQSGLVPPDLLPLLLVATGLLLAIAEAFAPGAHFIVLGVALVAAGGVGFFLPALATPFVLAGLVVVFGMVTLLAYRELDVYGGSEGGRTSDSSSLRGRTGRVTERVSPQGGEVKLDEGGGFTPFFSARSVSGEVPEGTEVIVVDPGGGSILTVESLGGTEDEIDRALREEARRSEEAVADESGNPAGDTESPDGEERDASETGEPTAEPERDTD